MKYHVNSLIQGTENPERPKSEALTWKQAKALAIKVAAEVRGSERVEDQEDVDCSVLHPKEGYIVCITGCHRGCRCSVVQAWKEK
jgi:hypothetical protein